MERRGVYRKGSEGHTRNVNAYRMMQEKIKKWRGPLLGSLAIVFAFGLAPAGGDQLFQTSILTSPETRQLVESNPELARKTILDYAAGIAKECEQYGMDECKEEGDLLLSDLSNESIDTQTVFNGVVHYEEKTLAARAKAACKYQAAQYMNDLKDAQAKLSTFSDSYGEALAIPGLNGQVESLKNQISTVSEMLNSCEQ